MRSTDMERAIRQALYTAYFAGDSGVGLHDVRATINADQQVFEQVVDRLYDQGLIHPHAAGWHYRITPHGIFSAEESGIVAADVARENREARHQILIYLAEAHEAERHHYGRPYEQIATDLDIDLSVVRPNLLLLTDINYVQAPGGGAFRISGDGLQAIIEWRRKTAITQEFEDLAKMSPRARGLEFQKLLARQIGKEDWDQEEGVRTSNEEMDVVFHKDHLYFIVECKWLKDPIEAKVIREFFGKLRNRMEVKGVVVSMSSFSAGALEAVQGFTGQATILLFGPEDIRSVFSFENTFTSLLEHKLKEFAIRRKVIFK